MIPFSFDQLIREDVKNVIYLLDPLLNFVSVGGKFFWESKFSGLMLCTVSYFKIRFSLKKTPTPNANNNVTKLYTKYCVVDQACSSGIIDTVFI